MTQPTVRGVVSRINEAAKAQQAVRDAAVAAAQQVAAERAAAADSAGETAGQAGA